MSRELASIGPYFYDATAIGDRCNGHGDANSELSPVALSWSMVDDTEQNHNKNVT